MSKLRGTLIRFEWIWADHPNKFPLYESYFWVTQTGNKDYSALRRHYHNWLRGDNVAQWIITDYIGDPDIYTTKKVQRRIKVSTIEEEDIEL